MMPVVERLRVKSTTLAGIIKGCKTIANPCKVEIPPGCCPARAGARRSQMIRARLGATAAQRTAYQSNHHPVPKRNDKILSIKSLKSGSRVLASRLLGPAIHFRFQNMERQRAVLQQFVVKGAEIELWPEGLFGFRSDR